MNDTKYSVDILINDKPIRKYPHNGKLFIESRDNQEYSIRIKNNTLQRILAITSIDGLDTLNGQPAKENSNGYVINGYGSLTLDGFRISDEKVARFIFAAKNKSYAASKGDNSERNAGVVGVRIFEEKVKPSPIPFPIIIREEHHPHHNDWIASPYIYPSFPTVWYETGGMGGTNRSNTVDNAFKNCKASVNYSCNNISVKGGTSSGLSNKSSLRACDGTSMSEIKTSNQDSLGFDMGTSFGKSKDSHVVEVEFEKGILTFSTNIYYASRQSLIEMGVVLTNEQQVSFPEPFVDSKYAKPPKGWSEK